MTEDAPGPAGPRTGVMPSSEQIAARHPELDDAPLRKRYTLEGKLGRGGMGVVAEAQDRRIGRRVAIKRLAGAPTPEMVARFVREARIQGRLDHPAVVPVYDLGIQSDGRPYFAMRRLSGVTLAEVLHARARGTAYPRARLLAGFVEACLAIEYAHTRGVVHRDLKPANIMLGEYGEVYLLDWGVACVLGEAGDAARGGGTAGYMAPEQARGEDIDARADVYGLGCILREILGDDVPADLADVLALAQAEDRAIRIGSARELAEAVERHLDADRDQAAQAARVERHVEAAQAALAADRDAPAARAKAMREIGSALALDPRHAGALALVRVLLLELPARPPPAVQAALDAEEEAAARAQGRTAAIACLSYLAVLPLLAWQGFRDWRFPVALFAVVFGVAAFALFGARGKIPRVWPWLILGGMTVVLIFLSRILGPFVLPPVMAVLVATAMTTSPRVRAWWWIAAGSTLGSLGALLLEQLGALAPTFTVAGDRLIMTSTVVHLPPLQVTIGLTGSLIGVVVITTSLVRTVVGRHHDARRRLARQAWHLQHMVPGDAGDPGAPP